jgi:hypothetical protein
MTIIDTTMEMPDSGMMDSVSKEIDKVIRIGKGNHSPHVKFHCMPQGFAYDFETPEIPDCLMDLDELEGFERDAEELEKDMQERICERMAPGCERRVIRSGGKGQSLNDLLGDIPMDRVVGYSIKDRKNGKRIIIDLDDAPMFDTQHEVVVIRDPGRVKRTGNHSGRQVKVYMNSDDDEQSEKATETTPPPPPPPPPDKTSPK